MIETALAPTFWIIMGFVFGAILGSFANVLIVRMPQGESVVLPASHCRKCSKPIRWYNNIPIVSYLLLRGKCANCGAHYSARYLVVELIMGSLFAVTVAVFGVTWNTLEYFLFIFPLVTACFIDIDHMILPDKFTLSGIVIGLVGAAINPMATRTFIEALLGVLIGGGFLWAIAFLYFAFRKIDGMGGGDIKLIAWIGAVLGWKAIPVVVLVSSILGSLIGITMALRTKGGLKHAIPFGPYLAIGALIYLYFDGARWAEWYLEMHGFEP